MNETAQSSGWTPPEWQAHRLRIWLEEWEFHKILRETNPPSRELPHDRPAPYHQPIVNFERNVAVGQIRLLPVGALASTCRLLYFAVVADWEDELKLIAPYARFSEPASTGELLTGRPERQVRVLCLWNAHTLPIELIGESWVVDRLSESEVDEAWAVFEHVAFGKPLPMALVERVGPPISHPRDPRIQYQQEEMRLMSPLARASIRWAQNRRVQDLSFLLWLTGLFALQNLKRAAGTTELSKLKEMKSVFHIPSVGVEIVFCMESDLQTVSLEVFSHQGRSSNLLDQTSVLNAVGSTVGRIERNQARIPATALSDGFRLQDAGGRQILLELKDERLG